MTDKLGENEATTNGAGQSVNVVIGTSGGRWIFAGVVALIMLIIFTNHTAAISEQKSDAATSSAANYAAELRMTQYWMQAADAACLAKGVVLPPDPFAKIGRK